MRWGSFGGALGALFGSCGALWGSFGGLLEVLGASFGAPWGHFGVQWGGETTKIEGREGQK